MTNPAAENKRSDQVRRKAEERIALAADDAAEVLIRLKQTAKSEAVRFQAASSLLDRAGLKTAGITPRDESESELQQQPERPSGKSIN